MEITAELAPTFRGLLFESGILIVFSFLLVAIISHMRRRSTPLTKLLLIIFLNYFFAIIFSWLGKFILLYYGVMSFKTLEPALPGLFFLGLITQYRLSFVCLGVGAYLTYWLKVKIFEKGTKTLELWFNTIFVTITIIFSLGWLDPQKEIYDLIAFFLIFLVMTLINLPFMIVLFLLYRRIEEPVYKTAILSLAIMSFCFLLILLGFFFDRLMIIFFGSSGYTIFYFAAWILVIVGIFSAYWGYIRPGKVQKQTA
jgi:hypothetical protein